MKEELLFQLGLNKNETLVYIALLKEGKATAGELIRKTKFHRNIVYDNLEKLIDKGLVAYILEGRKRIFQLANPEMLTAMVEKEQDEIKKRMEIAKKVKEEIKGIQKIKKEETQDAMIYRGINGLKLLFKETLKQGDDYFILGAPKSSLNIMGKTFWKNYNLKREERNIVVKMIFNEGLRKWSKEIKNKKTKIRYLPKQFDGISEIMIYGNKVAIIVWTENPIVTVIQDQNLVRSYKQYFEIIWNLAKE